MQRKYKKKNKEFNQCEQRLKNKQNGGSSILAIDPKQMKFNVREQIRMPQK